MEQFHLDSLTSFMPGFWSGKWYKTTIVLEKIKQNVKNNVSFFL